MTRLRRAGPAAVAAALAHALGAGSPPAWASSPSASRDPVATSAQIHGPPMSLEEVLREQRRLGTARFSPDGGRVLIALERQDRPSQGAPWRLANTEALVWRGKDGVAGAIQVDGTGFKPTLCQPWSPAGRYVAGLTLNAGERVAAAWDTQTARGVVFPLATASMCLPWAGERLVIPVPPAGLPGGGDSRARAAEVQSARWARAWTQDRPEVTVHSANPDFPGPAAPEGRLELADPATGEHHLLAPGDFHSMTASPDGRWLAAVRLNAPDPAALNKRTGRNGALVLFDLAGATPRSVGEWPALDVDYGALAWDVRSRRLLIGGRTPGAADLRLWTWDVPAEPPSSGGPAALAAPREIALPTRVRPGAGMRGAFSALRPIGWLGDTPAFIGAAAGAQLERPADATREYGDLGREALGLYAVTRQGVRLLTPFARQSVTRFSVDPDGAGLVVANGGLWRVTPDGPPRRLAPAERRVMTLAEERPTFGGPYAPQLPQPRVQAYAQDRSGRLRLVSIETHTGRVVARTTGDGVAAVSPRGDQALLQRDQGWSSTLALAASSHRSVLTLNPAWRDRPTGPVQAFDYAAGGRSLRGWIVRPPGANAAPSPALVWVYGGASYPLRPPRDALPGQAPTPVFSGQLWAARGYAVIYPSTPLPAARDGDIAQTLADQVVAAVDAAAARGWIDPRRVGVIGHSFGGFSAASILARRSDRFAAGVAMSGPYDFSAGWGARAPLDLLTDPGGWGASEETLGYVEDGQVGLGAPPYQAPDAYQRASPFQAAPRIRTPLLLTVGDFDHGGTSLAQAERFYAALKRSGARVVLVRYWGQDHVQDEPWAVRDQWDRLAAWFGRYLGVPSLRGASATRSLGRPAAP